MKWDKPLIFFLFLLGVIAFAIVTIIAIISIETTRHKKEAKQQLDAYEKSLVDRKLDEGKVAESISAFSYVLAREQAYFATYFKWQTLGKVFSILSIFLTIGTMAMTFLQGTEIYSQIISLTATGFVVFTIYMLPEKKYRQYIVAWRRCNKLVNDMICGVSQLPDYPGILKEIEDSLTSDED